MTIYIRGNKGFRHQTRIHIIAPDFPFFNKLKTGHFKLQNGKYLHIIGSYNLA
ncbi:hypothetical protein LCGC14_2248970, partial [marine sediment metagenome]